MNTLSLKNLSYAFCSDVCIRYPDASFLEGVTIIRGQSGSGKTTLFNLLLRSIIPTTGDIFYNRVSIDYFSYDRYVEEIVSAVLQGGILSDYFSLNEYLILLGLSVADPMVASYLELLDLKPLLRKNVSLCSGGEKYKIAFLLAVLKKAPILLLDEPTAHLDRKNSDSVIRLVAMVRHKIILLITHDEEVASWRNFAHYRV